MIRGRRSSAVALALLTCASIIPFGARAGEPSAAATPAPLPSVTAPPRTPLPAATLPASPRPEPTASGGTNPTPGPTADASPARATFPFAFPFPGASSAPTQAYATFVRGAKKIDGVIDLIRKDDDLYLDLKPENFDRTYVVLPSIASGVGSGAFAGRVYSPLPVTFKRVGKRVLWITPNHRYVAARGSAAAASLAVSVADGVVYSSPIVAEEDGKHVVIQPNLFLTDFEGIGADLGRASAPPSLGGLLLLIGRPSFALDGSKSYWLTNKGFPENDELAATLTFTGPANALPTVSDGRGIPIVVHYSIVAPTARASYIPRFADDRVGYFITARKTYGDDARRSPFERFIERWDLDRGPITFYLTPEIPTEYRATVRRAILTWNEAFAAIGRPNAIVVKDPPKDSNWDPDDARYSTVRWITSDAPDFAAYSPHVSDPDTGRILRAEVVIDGESMRAVKRGYVDRVVPSRRVRPNAIEALVAPGATVADVIPADSDEDGTAVDDCTLVREGLTQAALGSALLARDPHSTPGDRERYAQAWLFDTVLHEVGHTLGLRHNFRGSTAFTYAQLHDPAFTRANGTTASVMDYTPANIAAPGERQADYFNARLGAYDRWAIAFGYRRIPGATSAADEVRSQGALVAQSATNALLQYGTDEDAFDPLAIDPRIQRFDLSNDPLAFAAAQFRLDEALAATLDRRYAGDTRSYDEIRGQLIGLLNSELNSADVAVHYIGGIYTSRAHRFSGGAPPFASIPRAEGRRAFDLLDRYLFSARALRFSPALLNAAGPSRFGVHWGAGGIRRSDFPIREVVAELQDGAISTMLSPINVARVADQGLKSRRGETMSLADLFGWLNGSVYDDLGSGSIPTLHAELQRRFLDLQVAYAQLPSVGLDQLGIPREAQALARHHLRVLDARLGPAIARTRDDDTRAHLEDLRDKVRATLDARSIRLN